MVQDILHPNRSCSVEGIGVGRDVTGSDKFGEEQHIVASPKCKEQLFEEQRGHLTSHSGRALEVQNFRALPKGSNVVPFWVACCNPLPKNHNKPKKELHWSPWVNVIRNRYCKKI